MDNLNASWTLLSRQILGAMEIIKKDIVKQKADDTYFDYATSNISIGTLDGKPSNRIVIFLKGCGCEWANKTGGGCTMCGHLSGSSKGRKIEDIKLKNQFIGELHKYDLENYPIVCVYNGGSLLNNNETSPDVRTFIYKEISKHKGIKKLIVESRPEYITEQVLDEINTFLSGTTVEIGIGLECKNPQIRNIILNKNLSEVDLLEMKNKIKNKNVKLLAYITLKQPFLSEAEAIKEATDSIKYAYDLGFDAVSIEPISIQKGTFIELLAKNDLYTPPKIWSVFEVLKRTKHIEFEIRFGGFEFYPKPISTVSNCEHCDPLILDAVKEYNMGRAIDNLLGLDCEYCKNEWLNHINKEEETEPLVVRALNIIQKIK